MNPFETLEQTAQAIFFAKKPPITALVDRLLYVKEQKGTVFTMGNGGSHATASHFASDLLKACKIRAVCISDMAPAILAYNNDEGIRFMFDEIVRSLYQNGDLAVFFSCSGNSENIVQAASMLLKKNVALFTGNDGGEAQKHAEIVIRAENPNIFIQESVHSAICHAIVEAISAG